MKNKIILAGLLAGAAYGAYSFLLTDEAKENLKNLATKAMDLIKDLEGQAHEDKAQGESDAEANRDLTLQEWERLGY